MARVLLLVGVARLCWNARVHVILIETEGRGGAAEIELDGHRIRVVDGVSPPEERLPPGPVLAPKLEVVVIPHLTGPSAEASGAGKGLTPDHGWRYRAEGEIVSTEPLLADIGLLRLDLAGADAEGWAAGDRVSVAIDRIILTSEPG